MRLTNPFDVVQPQAKAFDVVHISGWDAVKLIEYPGLMFWGNANPMINDRNLDGIV